MIYVGIDVAKAKHDCCIITSDGEVICKPFTVKNNIDGFDEIYSKIKSFTKDLSIVKVGLEATGHFSINILNYLYEKGLKMYVFNPLHTNFYRKSLTLRKTKTDKEDCYNLAGIYFQKRYNDQSIHETKFMEMQLMSRYIETQNKNLIRWKCKLRQLIGLTFPEYENIIKMKIFLQKTPLILLKLILTPILLPLKGLIH